MPTKIDGSDNSNELAGPLCEGTALSPRPNYQRTKLKSWRSRLKQPFLIDIWKLNRLTFFKIFKEKQIVLYQSVIHYT